MQNERDAASAKVTHLESNITELQRRVKRANAAARSCNKEKTAAVSELETAASGTALKRRAHMGPSAGKGGNARAGRGGAASAFCRSRLTRRPMSSQPAARSC
eukprot:6195350-Pleurochrysis_carterae.AAC.2